MGIKCCQVLTMCGKERLYGCGQKCWLIKQPSLTFPIPRRVEPLKYPPGWLLFTNYYKDISLLIIPGKLCERMVVERLVVYTECQIGKKQCGFWIGIGSVYKVFVLEFV